MSKRLDAPLYEPGLRRAWLKIRCFNTEEIRDRRLRERKPVCDRRLAARLLRQRRHMHYAGRVGSGMDERELKQLFAILQPLGVKKMSVVQPPRPSRFDFGMQHMCIGCGRRSSLTCSTPQLDCGRAASSDGLLRSAR